MKRALITGITGQDGRYLAVAAREQGLPGVRSHPGPEQPEGRDGPARDAAARAGRRRPARPVVAHRRRRAGPARRGLQPRRDLVRAPLVHAGRAHVGDHRPRRAAHARSGAHRRRHRQQPDPLLPGVVVGDVRQGARDAADRAHAVPPALALRRGEGVRPPHDRELPRGVRHARVVGHPVQPRVARSAGSSSSPARSPTRWRASSSGCRTRSRSATSTPRATGASPATTSRRCGSCCSRTSPTTT